MPEKNSNKSALNLLCRMLTAFATLLAVAGSGHASSPGWFSETAPLVSPTAAKKILTRAPAAPTAAIPIAPQQMAASSLSDYTQLAEALENDPLRIYQFVRNNFEYVPYYGALKGPHLTLLERSGNDFDQAAVLVELLRAAGYTANYQYGTMSIPLSDPGGQDMASWLGSDADNTVVGTLIATGGIPALNFGSSFTIDRLWVILDINSTLYKLDPAFKPHTTVPGIDLAAAMGYNTAQLLAAAGGTTGPDSISNLSQAALDNHLAGLTSNLVASLRQNHPNARVRDIIGGSRIIPDTSGVLPTALPFAGTPTAPLWTDIPANYVHTVQFQHGGIDQTFDIPSIAGRKVSITYAGSGTQIDPPPPGAVDFGTVNGGNDGPTITWTNSNPNSVTVQLNVTLTGDNAFTFISGGGTHNLSPGGSLDTQVKFSGIGQTAGRKNAVLTFTWSYNGSVFSTNQVDLTGVVDVTPTAEIHLDDALLVSEGTPSGNLTDFIVSVDHPYAAAGGTFADQSVTFNLDRNTGSYVLASAFGGDRNSQLLGERQRMLDNLKQQGLADNSREVLTETLNIIGQSWMKQTQLNNELLGALSKRRTLQHHRFGIAGQENGYFVDIKSQFSPDLPTATTATTGAFQASSYIASAMEHSVLEQLQTPANPGISTIKVFALNNQNGNKFFLANQSNYGTIQSQLAGYNAAELANFQNIVNSNGTLVLPENGQTTLNSWTGNGYVDYRVNGSSRSMGMIISGGLNGGFCSIPGVLDPSLAQYQAYMESIPPGTIPRNMAADPVDLNSGAFVTRMPDISIAGDGPRGLAFTRHYNSRLVSQDTVGLGHGWTHSYNIYLTEHTDIDAGLGIRTPVDAAALIVATFATRDLVTNLQPTLQEWTVAALVADWASGQLLQKAVTVHLGDEALTFRELPDGSYAPPPGITADLVRLGDGTYELRERFGTVIKFNAANKITSLTDIEGNTLTFTYTGNQLTQIKDTYNRTLTLGYAGNQLVSVSDANGRSVSYTHTSGNLTNVAGLENAAWTYAYDTLHRLKTVTNPESVTIVDNTYDGSDRVIQQLAPRETGLATYRMHYTGLSSAEEDPLGNRTTYHYDFSRRTTAVEDALGNIGRIEYDGQGQTTKFIDVKGNTTSQAYDGSNNHIQTINALLEPTDFSYDALHRLERVTDALGHFSELDHDSNHRPVATRDGEGNQATANYLANGLIDTQTDARLVSTSYTYNTHGYPATSATGTQPPVTRVHDPIGRLTSITDQAATPTLFVHDDRGLITEQTDTFNRKTLSGYNGLGLLTSQTDRNGDTVTTAYTPSGKLDAINYPGHSVSFDYDSRDNLVTMTDPLGVTTNTFDALNRLTGHTDPNGFSVNYAYDEAGNLVQLTYPGNKTVTYGYDELNRISDISIDWLAVRATTSYDSANRLTGITNFNGTGTAYGYDKADRLVSITHQSGTQTLADYSYTLDPNGNRIQAVISNEPILPVSTPDATRDQTYNPEKNRLTQATTASGTINFTYDNNGQLLTRGSTSFTFDSAHRLTGFAGNSYQYDGIGNRLVAARNGTTTKYIYDSAGNLLAEADATNTIKRYYVYGIGLMAMVDARTSELFVYHFDGTGHTTAITDSSKAVVNRYAYDPYGELVDKNETVIQPFTYVGQYGIQTEPDGLYYMRARYYDARSGRFISEDPLGINGGLNLFAYAGGNPVTWIDPSGELPLIVILPAIGGLVSGGIAAIDAISNNQSFTGVAAAFGTGFASGAGGTLAGLGAGALTGNPYVAGAAGGAVSSLIDTTLSGGPFNAVNYASSVAIGAVSGPLASKLVPTHGRLPYLLKPRTIANFGPNSVRLSLQELISSTAGGIGGVTTNLLMGK